MKLIVGLGNPGAKYELTRHNVGFLAADRLVDLLRATGPTQKYDAEIYTAKMEGEQVLIIKPQTFMNLSGKSIGPLFQFYKCAPDDLIVLHDEIDIPPLTFRIKTGGSAAGHNGLKSIDEHVGREQVGYHRIRIGVGRSAFSTGDKDHKVVDHVLGPFSDQELRELDPILDQVAEAVRLLVRGQALEAMNKFNRKKKNEEKD